MKTMSVTDAKGQFSKMVKRVKAGEEIEITVRGHKVARLVPIAPEEARRLGGLAGKFVVPDDFDNPLILAAGQARGRASRKPKERNSVKI